MAFKWRRTVTDRRDSSNEIAGHPARVATAPGAWQMVTNAVWLAFDRGFRFVLVFGTGVIVTRYLGPEEAGRLWYAVALAAILGGFCDLGLDPIIRRSVIAGHEKPGVVMGTALGLRLMVVPVVFIVFAAMMWLNNPERWLAGLTIGVGMTVAWPVLLTFDSWFQAHTKARFSVWGQNGGYATGSFLRLGGVVWGASLAWFGWMTGLEVLVAAGLLVWLYRRTGEKLSELHFHRDAAQRLLAQTWSLALTNVAIMIYTRIDITMLSWLRGEHETGIYAAGVRVAEVGFIMPMILVNTFFPMLARAHAADLRRFQVFLQRLLAVVTWGGLLTGAVLTVAAPWLVEVFYGPAFAATASVIMISGWSGVFAGQGALRAQWLLFNNLQRFGLYYVSLGAGLNVLLNALLIPRWGGEGAAVASLATQAFVVLLAPLLFVSTRPSFAFLAKAFVFAGLDLRRRGQDAPQ